MNGSPGGAFGPIGIVYPRSKNHYATGFLVDRCNVLTVKHVVHDIKPAQDKELFFSVGPNPLRGRWASRGVVVATGNFNLRASAQEPGQGRSRDWLLLRLDECLGDKFGFLSLAKEGPIIGQTVESAGYPIDRRRDNPILDPNCQVRAAIGQTVLHDCATRKGNSGGPIFRRKQTNGNDQIEVVAMHSAGVPDRGVRSFNYAYSSIAIPIRSILPTIKPFLDLDRPTRG